MLLGARAHLGSYQSIPWGSSDAAQWFSAPRHEPEPETDVQRVLVSLPQVWWMVAPKRMRPPNPQDLWEGPYLHTSNVRVAQALYLQQRGVGHADCFSFISSVAVGGHYDNKCDFRKERVFSARNPRLQAAMADKSRQVTPTVRSRRKCMQAHWCSAFPLHPVV